MFKHNVWKTLQKSIILVLVFLLAMEPVLVAASPQLHEPRQKEIETFASRHITQVNTGEISFHMLFQNADVTFKGILNGLKLTNAFEVVVDLVKVVSTYITTTIHSLNDAIQVLQDILSGGLRLWDDFTTLVKRVGATRLISWGVNDSTFLVGHILRLLGTSVSLSDEALTALKSVADDLVAAGVDLSDDAAQGLGLAAKGLSSNELRAFANTLKANGPEHLETILTAYKNFGTTTREGAEKIAQKLGGENFATLMSKFAANSGDADQVFRILGNTNISKDALQIAMNQSPEAVHALSFWKVDFLNDSNLAKKLALRAGEDADSLAIIKNWTLGRPPTLEELQRIGRNSRDGIGNAWGLGKNSGYDQGYVKFARENDLRFYFTHPDVSARIDGVIVDQAEKDAAYWAINKEALDGANGPIDQGMNFLSQKNPLLASNDKSEINALEAIWAGESEDVIKAKLGLQPNDSMPFRFREFHLLFNNDYQYTIDAAGNFFFLLPGL